MRYTPHDFRRLWATDAVSNGLPVHIAAKLLGHKNINTTQTYVAVFDEHTSNYASSNWAPAPALTAARASTSTRASLN
ncbi:site-specific integrase [Nocardia sp. NPDC057663]|uniref:site-specific integrase n=1 Tax=Nocardia sp. NPDC057663 TaxID=3346201 RepID=UPI00366D755F